VIAAVLPCAANGGVAHAPPVIPAAAAAVVVIRNTADGSIVPGVPLVGEGYQQNLAVAMKGDDPCDDGEYWHLG